MSLETVNPVHEYMDAAEAMLVHAEYEDYRDRYYVPAALMEAFRDWHARITGRRIAAIKGKTR